MSRAPLELVQESNGNLSQGAHAVIGRGIQAAGKRVLANTAGRILTVHPFQIEGEHIEPGLQGDVAVQLISQDGQEIHAIGR